MPSGLAVTPMFAALSVLSFGCTSRDLRVLMGLWYTGTVYVIGLENPCQLFQQLTNVGETYGIFSSAGFSGVDVLLISLWLNIV